MQLELRMHASEECSLVLVPTSSRVVYPKKPEKFRVFLDCVVRLRGLALNGQRRQGFDITANLTKVLVRSQENVVVLAASVEEMYMQVKVPKDNQGAPRLLWWPGIRQNRLRCPAKRFKKGCCQEDDERQRLRLALRV